MEIWLVVILGPLVFVLGGWTLLKLFSFLGSVHTEAFLWVAERIALVTAGAGAILLIAFALLLVTGLVFLWQMSPLLAIVAGAAIAANGMWGWSVWRQRLRPDEMPDERSQW